MRLVTAMRIDARGRDIFQAPHVRKIRTRNAGNRPPLIVTRSMYRRCG